MGREWLAHGEYRHALRLHLMEPEAALRATPVHD